MTTARPRRPDIDWLRVLATLLVVAFHVAMVFNPAPFFHLRNADVAFPFLIFCAFVSLWHMPLFFVLAGWSLAAGLDTRGSGGRGGVVRERLLRLGVPLVAGSVLLMPWIKYVELRGGMDLNHRGLRVTEALEPTFRSVIRDGLATMPGYHEPVAAFLPTFFTQAERFSWGHLWFVAYLLAFTLVLLPVLKRWPQRQDASARRHPALAWAPLPLLIAIQVLLRPLWPGIYNLYDDWANVSWYMTFFVAGFALARDPGLEALVHAQWKKALAVGAATCVVLLGGVVGLYDSPTLLLAGSAVAGWSFVVAILGAGRRHLSFSSPALRYLAEAALPVYVLHQAAIVLPGWWIVALPLGIAPKLLLLLVVAYALSLGTYHVLVRPLQPMRVLLGMRPLACPLPRTRAAAPAAVAILALLLAWPRLSAAGDTTPIGTWYAEGGAARVEVRRCGQRLCGRVVWLRSPLDENGCPMRDLYNPDAALRGRPLVGIDILNGLEAVADDTWDGGTIYDPTSGRTYRCTLSTDGDDRLLVRGYVGFHLLGRTTTWIRAGHQAGACLAATG